MSGYFVGEAARCVVMLMVSEKGDPDTASSTTATPRSPRAQSRTTGLDSEEGRSLNFTCGEGATALLVDVAERERESLSSCEDSSC
jgi:hypothetical protein